MVCGAACQVARMNVHRTFSALRDRSVNREDNFVSEGFMDINPRFEISGEEPDSTVFNTPHGRNGQFIRVRDLGRLSKDAYYRPPITFLDVLLDLCRDIFGRKTDR